MLAKSKGELSGAELSSGLLSVLAALNPEPVSRAVMSLSSRMPELWERRYRARTQAWFNALCNNCGDGTLCPAELAAQIEQKMIDDAVLADEIIGQITAALSVPYAGCVPVLGALHGAYYGSGSKPDPFFRAFTDLLMQCAEEDLAGVRELVGRCACIEPETKSRTLLVKALYHHDTWLYDIDQLELEATGWELKSILGAGCPAPSNWRRIYRLLAVGIAHAEGPSKLVVEVDAMRRMQAFLKLPPQPTGPYRYSMRGGSGAYTAELESISYCYGFGASPDAALKVLRDNMPMFTLDGRHAALVEVTSSIRGD